MSCLSEFWWSSQQCKNQPPGRSTRKTSFITSCQPSSKCNICTAITTSNESSDNGKCSISAQIRRSEAGGSAHVKRLMIGLYAVFSSIKLPQGKISFPCSCHPDVRSFSSNRVSISCEISTLVHVRPSDARG